MTSTLRIGDRIVLRAESGAPEAEFALFDPGDIELLATDPGIVREVGYRTTAGDAARRLDVAGLTMALVQEIGAAMVPGLAAIYARGAIVRRAAARFGAAELFESSVFDPEQKRYDGTWLDLPALCTDVEVLRANAFFQSVFLRARVAEVPEETDVVLDTRDVAAQLKPGQRSYRRVSFEHVGELPSAIRAAAERMKAMTPQMRDEGPTKSVLLESLRARIDLCSDPITHERFTSIEAALAARERPARGPLSDVEIWALEERMSAGETAGVLDEIDKLDKRRGRDPATAYLRARALLLSGREAPSVIAEKAAAMAMSMSSFPELELLAAEAWAAAGQMKRAAPFARDLIDNPGTDDDLRARAVQLLSQARVSGAASVPPTNLKRTPIPPRAPSQPPSHESDRAMISVAPPPLADAPDLTMHRPSAAPAALSASAAASPSAPPPASPFASSPPAAPGGYSSLSPPASEVGNEDETLSRRLSSRAMAAIEEARRASSRPPSVPPPRGPSLPPPPPLSRASIRPPGGSIAPPAGSIAPPIMNDRGPSVPPVDVRRSLLPQTQRSPELMRGASQPPFRADSPAAHMHIPKAPPLPRGTGAELASELVLPPGLQGQPTSADMVPTSVIDARIHFTFLARQLGEVFRAKYNLELYADASGIEAIQPRLLDDYPDGALHSHEQALDVRRYGAFLSEILARSFGAFWVDIAPADLGYWAMVVPPDTRVWPFGRVLRFIAMAHKERDLVAYYLELLARADRL